MKRLICIVFAFYCVFSFATENPETEQRILRLSEKLRCLVCQNQSLADSPAELAGDMRREVREQVSAGRSDEQIVNYLVQRKDRTTHRPAARSWFSRDGGLRCAGSVRDGSGLSWAVGRAFGARAIDVMVNAACICRDQASETALRAERARP